MLQTARFPPMDGPFMRGRIDFVDDSVASGAEGRARKRLQRAPSENDDPLRRTTMSLPFSRLGSSHRNGQAGQGEQKVSSGTTARRRSTLRETKQPLLGPRPLENKRVLSESHSSKYSGPPPVPSIPRTQPNFGQASASASTFGSTEQFQAGQSFARNPNPNRVSTSSTDFLPSVNFDDFHTSINSSNYRDPDHTDFPLPGPYPTLNGYSGSRNPSPVRMPSNTDAHKAQEEPKVPRSQAISLGRRFSNARSQANNGSSTISTSMPPPTAPASAAARNRRQSTHSSSNSSSFAQSTRFPRKSVGPGVLSQGMDGRAARDGGRVSINSQGSLSRSSSVSKSTRPTFLAPSSSNDASRSGSGSRSLKAKSLQPPPRGQTHPYLASGNESINVSQTTLSPRSPGHRTQTPSSLANKRQSSMYVSGLGARTISPTDARRKKRLSGLQKNTTISQALASQSDLTSSSRKAPQSPARIARKSVTPSSARTTPDVARKAVGSGQSLSSSSSFSSLRPNNVTSAARPNPISLGSRLPAPPKPRNVHSSAGMIEEEVPPVPAIPKAYESPKEPPSEQTFLIPRKPRPSVEENPPNRSNADLSAMPSFQNSIGSASTSASVLAAPEAQIGHTRQGSNPRHRRGLTIGSDAERAPPAAVQTNRKNLLPNRLPPLNLHLSAPTEARIASFPAPSEEVDGRHATTPPKRCYTKTPSTPLTASKATFFSRHQGDEEDGFMALSNMRSSSSHHLPRYDPDTLLTPTTPVAIPVSGHRQTTTPFASNSLPKSNEFGQVAATPVDQYHYNQSMDIEMGIAPLPSNHAVQIPPKKDVNSTRTSSSDEPGTPASNTSLRRKLSLNWKRSSSKASQRAQNAPNAPNAANAANSMNTASTEKERDDSGKGRQPDLHPPKPPTSATWGPRMSGSTEASSTRPSLDLRPRKASGAFILNPSDPDVTSTGTNQDFPKVEQMQPPSYSEHRRIASRSSSQSILAPMHRMLGTKSSLSTLKARNLDTNLDKDDLQADKIMEKLASKRKDFEQAAREVDDLRRRARRKERQTPATAIQVFNLNIFERGEIIDYKEVYFCGTKNAKKHVGDLDVQTNNFGYDDDRGDYNIVLGDHLAYRYEVVDVLGKGSFGQVVRCIDYKTGGLVAVKIIRNKKRFHQQALVEVNILQKLREWDPENKHSMIDFTQSFYFRGHLCISTELLGMNLYEFIKANEFKGFQLQLIRRFTKQILSALVLLKSKRVIHCDLKPENILLAHPLHSEIKVIDFGSSCFETEKVYTYIQSRFYRSPEVILGMSYGIPIDMWSLGCILAELYSGYPIFPGENEQEQLACIMEIFGPPEKHLIEKSSRKKLFFDSMGKPRVTVSSKGRRRRPSSKTLNSAIKCDDEPFLDFLAKCLRWDPDRRLRPEDALQHEFVTGVKRPPMTSHHPRSLIAGGGSRAGGATASAPPINHSSPVKRYNTVAQTPSSRFAGSREPSGSIRPLPEPPQTAFRHHNNPTAGSASPNKVVGMGMHVGGGQRRHSAMTAAVPGSGPSAAGGKRVNTTSVLASGTGGAYGGGHQGVVGRSMGPAGVGATGGRSRVGAGGGDLASAAAAASLVGAMRRYV